MSKDFHYSKDDLEFWRKSTSDLKHKADLQNYDNFSEDNSSDDMSISLSREEVLNFRNKGKLNELSNLDELELDSSADIDKNTYSKFKNGKMHIDATLDMHGMTLDIAYSRLKSLIDYSYKNEKRCLLIITGKGLFSGGVLKKSLPKCVNSPEIRPKIISFSSAIKSDGGSGAFYILIKRKK